jgi:DNA topoisomerase VI subunit A
MMLSSRNGIGLGSRRIDCRDIYYRNPALFGNQGIVDRIVDGLAYTLLIPRSCLHVVIFFSHGSDDKGRCCKGLDIRSHHV